ncbi:MAG TPA: hypothetical protein VEW69_00235, partial [Alphaproteobacteria bacterium]|nr:hypothetical protein [Alphaproteobacteria bacterium]
MQPAMDFPRSQAGNSRRSKPGFGYFRLVAAVYLFSLLALSCYAKEPLVAIVVFDSANRPSYMQVAAVTINGKTDLRSCDGVARINKQAYDFLPKVSLKAAATLQRGADGVLTLSEVDAAPTCVVPDNMKFERNAVFTPAQAADQAIIQGTVTPPSEQVVEIPAFKPGVLLYFVPAPDVELAEFLRAQRANSLAGWQAYLDRYASSSHAGLAKQGMAVLLMQMAKTALAEYGQTAAAHAPQFELLKHAQNHAEKMRELLGPNPATQKLLQAVHEQIDVALATSRQELQLYQKALAQRSSGLAHLIAAARLSKPALAVDPGYPAAAAMHREVTAEESTLESALENAESLLRAHRYDDALNALGPYRDVAPEMPRIASVVNEVYTFHFTRGQEFNAQQNWEQAAAA